MGADRDFPLVSVVIPSLNSARFVRATLESILQQDYPKIECLVIDGGSTDGTLEILKSYGSRIRWISEPDRGHAHAINKGLKMSRGEFLAVLNPDDLWEIPGAVRAAVEYLSAHPDVDCVYGLCGSIGAEGNRIGMSYLHEWNLEYAVEYCDHCIPEPASFIRRRALEAVDGFDENLYQKKDHDLWLRISLRGGKIQHIPVLLGHARDTRGLSFDGRTSAPACVEITKKFFRMPHVPDSLLKKKRRALSNSYLRGIEYAWLGGRHVSIVMSYAVKAVWTDPSNTPTLFAAFWRFLKSKPWRKPLTPELKA
jgi:glycosyltransferase involved in cell wall biosynthesis